MARTISTIQQQMLDAIAADATLSSLLTSTSKRAVYRLFTYIVAVGISVLEQLIDIFYANAQTLAAQSAPGSAAWLQYKIFQFQYSATVAQIVQLINFQPTYSVIDPTLQIISRCSVGSTIANKVQIKVATGSTPAALSAPQLSALQSYVTQCGIAGVDYTVTSGNPDQLYIECFIYYTGQYSSVIQATVTAAITAFLASLPFNGQMKVGNLETALRNVQGVTDVILVNVIARADATAFGSGTPLVSNQQLVGRLWPTVAGYMISETTTGQTINDKITYIAQ
jgi:hypothetical protein